MLIWEQLHRQELADFLDRQKQIVLRNPDEVDPAAWSSFQFSALEKELIIGPVFVRVFNEQPQFALPDSAGFLKSLLDYLGNQAQYFSSLPRDTELSEEQQSAIDLKLLKTCMALESVKHVLTTKPELCTKCLTSLRYVILLISSFSDNLDCLLPFLPINTRIPICLSIHSTYLALSLPSKTLSWPLPSSVFSRRFYYWSRLSRSNINSV